MTLSAMDLVAIAKQNITETELKTVKQALSKELILDVREPEEHVAGCLPGAVNIPRGVLEFKIGNHPEFENKQEAKIFVYCQTGGRSALATETLQRLGYENAVSMAGGFKAWTENGHQITQP
jgi:rhodanese-related sulfurtransferase